MSNQDNKITLSDEVIKYYDDLLNRIKEDFNNGQQLKAINRLNEELEQTYMPYEYLQIFENQLHQFEAEYRANQLDESLKKLSQDEMLHKIYVNKQFNVYLFDYFLQAFHKNLHSHDFLVMEAWLQDPHLVNEQKFYVLDALAHFEINHDFVLENSNTKDDVVLNTINFHEHDSFAPFNETLKILEDTLFKDQIVIKFASDLLNAVTAYYFPTFEFKDPQTLAKIILKIINASMNFILLDPHDLNEDERKVYKIFLQMQDSDLF